MSKLVFGINKIFGSESDLFLKKKGIDWILFLSTLPIVGAGLLTMSSFQVAQNAYFDRQIIWVLFSLTLFFIASFVDFRFLRRTDVLVTLFVSATGILLFLFVAGGVVRGSKSWFDLGGFSFQPSDPVKILLVMILAKYFSRRHIEIAHIKHIFVSGLYAFIFFFLVFLQPDFGSAVIIFLVWFGMVLVSGISKKHIIAVFMIGVLSFGGLWFYVFKDYQKQRIMTFLNPLTDIQGSGYNAYQSTIAVGSGEIFGKGIGFGTQSRLKFLPEYQTDFIFAAYAEEWGFVGVLIIFIFYGIIIFQILRNSFYGATNFEMLYGLGLAVYMLSHFTINVGMNIGLLPVTGITLPFMSYGGSHLVTEYLALGILMGMRRYSKETHKDSMKNEFLGV